MNINLEIVIASLALILSLVSLYHQFFHKEIVVYPGLRNENLYLHVENSGQSLIHNFFIEIINMDELLSGIKMSIDDKKSFKNRDGLNGKASNTLSSKGKRTILLGDYKSFIAVDPKASQPFPILSIKVRYKGFKKSKTFVCDYNSYRNELIDHDVSSELREINKTLKSRKRLGI